MFIYLVHMKQKMTTIKNYSIKKIRESYGINTVSYTHLTLPTIRLV